ncbi:MAG: Gfo/Idh/MocA family oxidoreductase [Thaumarchaeota archaeon]|jgi:predicted dehydrogenase|nr:Gfo/Idh/MocA family oxidoreductase [Nitrososphaerota archaeon]
MKSLNMAVIGCGNIANYAHLPNLLKTGQKLVATCDIVEEKAKQAAEKFKADRFYTDYRKVLELKDLDAVIIATPPDTHKEIAVDAVRTNKHVFLEKPLAANLEDAYEIYSQWKRSNVKFAVGFCLRHHGMFKYAKELVENNTVGEPVALWRIAIGTAIGVLPPMGWLTDRERSGGMVVENSIHMIDAFRWFAGDIASALAQYKTERIGINIEDNAYIVFTHRNNAFSSILQSWTATHTHESWGIVGKQGTVSVKGYVLGTMEVSSRSRGLEEVKIEEDPIVMYEKEMEDFVKSILEDKPVFATPLEGLKAMEAAVAAEKSSKEGKLIKLPLIDY